MSDPGNMLAADIGAAVASRELSALDVVQATLQRIDDRNGELNCYTEVTADRALQRAAAIDARVAAGDAVGPLAGVPFAVKNLFDIAGVTTLAGSKICRDNAPAVQDAVLVRRLEDAGAILLGALAMGEFAYDFTGENEHYGACRNPWDSRRMSGGSSSGSGSATAAGLAPISLGSDTNGSIRVPSSLCGLFGLKPTYGRLPRTGSYPFCDSLDHLGPLARSAGDLALAYDCLQGFDAGDPACAQRPIQAALPSLDHGIAGLRIGVADGYFGCADMPEADWAVKQVCAALDVQRELPLAGADAGRSAAYLITNAEGAELHREHLRTRLEDFDADTRERFLAGALWPAGWYLRAQAVRRWWLEQMLETFREVDLVVAPCTPCTAPLVGTRTLVVRGVEEALRPNLGLFTQPFSAIGLPVVSVPLLSPASGLPIGVQLVAPPWREDLCLRAAKYLQDAGLTIKPS